MVTRLDIRLIGCVLLLCAAPMVAIVAAQDDVPEDENMCILCHGNEDVWDEDTKHLFVTAEKLSGDIHWQKGLRCQNCHGGNPETTNLREAHAIEDGFRDIETPADIPGFCGHCHSNFEYMRRYTPSARTDQEAEYWTSGHGRRLKETSQGENAEPDKAVATCVDCHGHHGMHAVKDTNSPVYPTHIAETCARCHSDEKRMADRVYNGRPLGHQQYENWRNSIHGQALMDKGDLAAPACNDCHGNHGAMPPGLDSVANACGTCHGKVAKLFAETRMKHGFEERGLPGCAACHGSHAITQPTDEMLGMQDAAVCATCHNPENPQYGATVAGGDVAKTMRDGLEKLKREILEAEEIIEAAEQLGMEVRGPRFDLRQAVDSLTNARTLVHSFKPEPIGEALDEGLTVTKNVKASAEKALGEHTRRRVWLAASLAPLLLVVVVLLLYIRTLPPPAVAAERAAPAKTE